MNCACALLLAWLVVTFARWWTSAQIKKDAPHVPTRVVTLHRSPRKALRRYWLAALSDVLSDVQAKVSEMHARLQLQIEELLQQQRSLQSPDRQGS